MSANPLLARFVGAAALAFLSPDMQTQFETCIHQANLITQAPEFQAAVRAGNGDFWGFEPDSYMSRMRPYVVVDGILQIPVKGVLLHDFPYALGGWATGYDYIWQAFKRGMGDANVKGIAIVCDTPGGQVAGNFDCVDRMYALKQEVGKPVRGYAAETAYSAGFSVISVCDTITVSRSGGVGSVGVVTGHLDMSGAMEKAGLKFTYVFAGKHKVDGNPYEPLSADAQALIQKRIDALYDDFVAIVARNRPKLSEQEVRDSEALTFTAPEALSNGFADAIGALDDSLAEYAADLTSDEGDTTMSTKPDGTVDMAAHETAVAAARVEGKTEGHAAGLAQGRTEGATAERARINAIIASDVGKERPKAAMSTALNTDMSAETAGTFLATLDKETPASAAAPATPFQANMDQSQQPNVSAGGGPARTEAEIAAAKDSPDETLALAHSFGVAGLRAPVAK